MTRQDACDVTGGRRCDWQRDDGLCAAVLHEVFGWLDARALCAAAGTCRAWRSAAAAPALWRRLLARDANLAPRTLQLLSSTDVWWREEYVRSFAGWEPGDAGPAMRGARHAALAPDGRLALVSEDAEMAIWNRSADGAWSQHWSTDLRSRGWASAERAQWAGSRHREGGARLLLTGVLALVDSWELLVVQLNEEGAGRVVSRARCSAGAGGCWAGAEGEAFLSMELRLLAPRIAFTIVRVNAATQETESEYVGVTSPLLRIYNEDAAHITLVAVAEVPPEDAPYAASADPNENDDVGYFRAMLEDPRSDAASTLVTGRGVRGAGALCAWTLPALRPAPLHAAAHGGDLRERHRRHAARPPAPLDPPVPEEDAVRALCTAPLETRALPAPPAGLVLHRSGRCAWVSLSGGGAWCVSLPRLVALRRLASPSPTPRTPDSHQLLHYVQPALSDMYFASPTCGGLRVWSALSGATCPSPRAPRLSVPSPAAVALLPPFAPGDTHPTLLVLAGDAIQVWRSRAPLDRNSDARRLWLRRESVEDADMAPVL